MNKGEFIEKLSHRLGGDRKASTNAVDAMVSEIEDAVSSGESVNISGFGVFEKRDRAARNARNPRTGEPIKVKKTTVPAFRPGNTFKGMVAEKGGSSSYSSPKASSYSAPKSSSHSAPKASSSRNQQPQAQARTQRNNHPQAQQPQARTQRNNHPQAQQPQARTQRSLPAGQSRTATQARVTRSAPQGQSKTQSQPRAQASRSQSQSAQHRQPRGQQSSYGRSSYGQTSYAQSGKSSQQSARMVVK
jgi:DNA-binding protein HU-beta